MDRQNTIWCRKLIDPAYSLSDMKPHDLLPFRYEPRRRRALKKLAGIASIFSLISVFTPSRSAPSADQSSPQDAFSRKVSVVEATGREVR